MDLGQLTQPGQALVLWTVSWGDKFGTWGDDRGFRPRPSIMISRIVGCSYQLDANYDFFPLLHSNGSKE
jgi:hypothetical protein